MILKENSIIWAFTTEGACQAWIRLVQQKYEDQLGMLTGMAALKFQ